MHSLIPTGAPAPVARSARAILCVTGLLGMVLASGAAFAQETGDGQGANPRLDLGLAVAAHGSDVELTLTLRLRQDVGVGKLEAEVRFPRDQMSFVAPRPTRTKGIEVDVTPQTTEEGKTVLKVTAKGVGGPIPGGPITTLVFRVADEATETVAIQVPLEARLWAHPDTSREITPVDTYDGRVTIQDSETFFACFFYMH